MARGNFGDPDEHARAGHEGGKVSGNNSDDQNFQEKIDSSDSSESDQNGRQFKKNDEWTEKQARKGGEASGGNTENLRNQ